MEIILNKRIQYLLILYFVFDYKLQLLILFNIKKTENCLISNILLNYVLLY
jgi:hypothetical protein